MRSERVEEYLEAILKRQQVQAPVTTSSLAADLGVSLPAVTDMMQRLALEGLIEYEPNKGATLTAEGRRTATTTVRRHRLWERFLTDVLGFKWDRVHEQACRLEHATSPETEDRLASLMGGADTCPHGHPIPDKGGNMASQRVGLLSSFHPGQVVCISAIARERPGLLRKVEKWGLKPGTVVSIERKSSEGSIELKLNHRKLVLDKDSAKDLLAKPVGGRKEKASEEIPVSELRTGESGVVKSYAGGRGMLGRCLSMGFTPGALVRMIKNYGRGPILVSIRSTEVALGREIAGRIMVTRKRV